MGVEALYMLPIAILVGFLVFERMVQKEGVDAFWLKSVGERLSFFLWPRPPRNVVHIVMPNGQMALLYDVRIQEKRDSVIIDTPLGKLRSPENNKVVVPLLGIHLPGLPSPFTITTYALTGLILAWIVFYYAYLFLGFEFDTVFTMLAFLLIAYIYMYYNAARTTAMTEYHEYEVHGLAPPYLHAIPGNISPVRRAKYMNQPILIRVTKTARESMENLKKALSIKSDSEVAELLATGELVELLFQQATRIRSGAMRIEKLLNSFEKARIAFGIGKITLGKVALLFFAFLVGLLVGWALNGGTIVVAPIQHNQTLAGVTMP